MNKNDIKTKWGKYVDTDKLVDDMMSLLTKYQHRNTEHGVCCVLEKFFTNKEPLIKLLQKSEHYTGDLRIVLDEQLERRTNQYEVRDFVDCFPTRVSAADIIKTNIDSNGKTMADYLKIGKQKICIADLEDDDFNAMVAERSKALDSFTYEGITKDSDAKYNDFINAISLFRSITSSILDGDLSGIFENYKISNGMKTSRAFNRICHHFSVDITPIYNKEFAKYADMVSGLKRNIKFFISVNPLDYLTMSFGVNWASCHTIDRANVRGMANSYSGGYCGGTMSYMLDEVSIVTYVHDKMPEDHETGKVYRNMFHLGGDGVLLQGRVYPQGNDGSTDLYREFRSIMQSELTKLLGLTANKWTKRSSITNIESVGVHYRDYNYNRDCNISYPTERIQCVQQTMTVGSTRVCTYCGEEDDSMYSSYLAHTMCAVPAPATTDEF